ncbi:MAG: acetyl-CoA C-acyltransferase [Ostreibacterium sp.]
MKRQINEAYIVSAIRSPVGKVRGGLAQTRPDDLLATVLKTLLQKNPSLDPTAIDDVIIGCAMPEGAQGLNVARIALLLAGYPDSTAGMTVNRFCSSGLQSIAMACERVQLGMADVMVAGGVESMSMVPMMGNTPSVSPAVFTDDNVAIAYGMGITAEKVADKYQVSREQQDAFALQSHERALAAIGAGEFTDEIIPIDTMHKGFDLRTDAIQSQQITVSQDEGPRKNSRLALLAKLRPVFAASGSVTAGNSSQMSDGAGAILICSEAALKQYGLIPMAKFRGYSVAGVPPEIMGIGPVKAIPKVLEKLGLTIDDMDWIELNEAFAAQSLAVMNTLALNPEKVNPLGGAIALGHPLGATGSIRSATCLHALQRRQLKYGMVTMCIGTGMGAAGVFERV